MSDGSFIPANVSWNSKVEITRVVEQSTVDYLEALDIELKNTEGYTEPVPAIIKKKALKSVTDPDCGSIHQELKKGLGYLTEMTVDTGHGIITGVDYYPANRREGDIILKHLQKQIRENNLSIEHIGLDAGYDGGAVHRGLEVIGIDGYTSLRYTHHNPMKEGFGYVPEQDCFLCVKGKELKFSRLIFKKGYGYYRLYRLAPKESKGCENGDHCSTDDGSVRINASAFYPAYHANRVRTETIKYRAIKRLRSIWSEGTFAALKNNHNLKRLKKRGINRAVEECLLAAAALNLKRMIKAI
ncbi:hypothetical protein FACS1894142_8530 [Spirochaetia bacterium]|nr:hypothetical protein FACS1894142_8530 [Spirochaetia bacterium]